MPMLIQIFDLLRAERRKIEEYKRMIQQLKRELGVQRIKVTLNAQFCPTTFFLQRKSVVKPITTHKTGTKTVTIAVGRQLELHAVDLS